MIVNKLHFHEKVFSLLQTACKHKSEYHKGDEKISHNNYADSLYSMSAYSRQEALKTSLQLIQKRSFLKRKHNLFYSTKDLPRLTLLLTRKRQFSNLEGTDLHIQRAMKANHLVTLSGCRHQFLNMTTTLSLNSFSEDRKVVFLLF